MIITTILYFLYSFIPLLIYYNLSATSAISAIPPYYLGKW